MENTSKTQTNFMVFLKIIAADVYLIFVADVYLIFL